MESPQTEQALFAFLDSLGIKTATYRHAPVFTVEEARAERVHMPAGGGHCKSLFVRDKKKRRALVMVDEDRRVDLRGLADTLGMGRLSFSSADSLMTMLGVLPGSVTPFALINAPVAPGAEPPMLIALDAAMMAKAPLYYHPLHNAATTAIDPGDLLRFIRACGYNPITVKLD